METTSQLAKRLLQHKEQMLAMLTTPEFYVELLLIGCSLALAWLMALLIRRRVKTYLLLHPPRRVDPAYITKPLTLLAPLLAFLYLSVAKPLAVQYGDGGDWTDAFIRLSAAYILARMVLMLVRSRPVAWFLAFVIMGFSLLDVTGFMKSVTLYLESLDFSIGTFHISMLNLVHGVIILVIVFWMAGTLSRSLEGYLRRSSTLSYSARELTVKFFRVFVYFVAFMITLSALGVDLTAFAVFGGALGVGIGLGLQKITANFVSGITLLMEKSIQIGDLIEVGGMTGHVRQLNIRYALIETPDGREVLIPNEELVSTRVINWTHTTTNARVDIPFSVAYGSDCKQVMFLALGAAREHPQSLKTPEPWCYLRTFGESGLNFLLTFWVGDINEGRNAPQSDVMISLLEKFSKAGIVFPFPQREIRLLGEKQG